ncbi:MAG: MFS transporter [Bacillota bacterium]
MRRNLTFIILAGAYLLLNFHRVSMGILALDVAGDLGLTPVMLGSLGAAFMYPYGLIQVPSGLLSDVLDPSLLVKASCLLMALGSWATAASRNYSHLVMARALLGFGSGLLYLPAIKILSRCYRASNLGVILGLLTTAGNLGAVVSTAPLAIAMGAFGWRTSLNVMGLTCAGLFLCALAEIRGEGAPGLARHPGGLPVLVRDRAVWVLSAWMLVLCATKLGWQSLWAGGYLTEVQGLDMVSAGTVLLAMTLGGAVGGPIAGGLSDRLGSRRKVLLGVSLACSAWWLAPAFHGMLPHLFHALLYGFLGLASAGFVVAFAWVQEHVGREHSGLAMGILNSSGFLGTAFSGQVVGRVLQIHEGLPPEQGFRSVFLWSAILMAGVTLALACVREKKTSPVEPGLPAN